MPIIPILLSLHFHEKSGDASPYPNLSILLNLHFHEKRVDAPLSLTQYSDPEKTSFP
jgi:hypothetical protein